ncbi:urease accessory protein F-like [Elysia marginata]|uniref:Urease accessory protein F-like n=1 Tax=Elysia marginata TaxID=1093978 RepID=A0AAV4GVX0_9GAST|nr:urease accessory protein F-like [Elysia marginata]
MDEKQLFALLQLTDSGSLSLPFVRAAHSVVVRDTRQCDQLKKNPAEIKAQDKRDLNGHRTDNSGLLRVHSVDKAEFGTIESLTQLDRLYEASTANHIARRSSTRQGRSLLEASLHTFPILEEKGMEGLGSQLPHCHHAVLHGAIMGCLDLALEDTISSYMFGVVRTLVATAVRLDVLGAMEGQRLQWKLQEICADVIKRNKMRPVEQAGVKFPVLDILQNTQDTLFAKLFYS